jgi:threonine aldolase
MLTVDLRSDTVTKPGKEMLDYMFSARVGDMVLGEDPMVNELEEYAARLFGKDGAIFCPSGTMTNQIAINIHTRPGDDIICSKLAHIYLYEGGGIGFNSGANVTLIDSADGIFTVDDVRKCVQPDDPHKPRTSLVSLENSVNRGGGAVWPLDAMEEISRFTRSVPLALHLDGARVFNAIVASGITPLQFGSMFDTISVCLSKGLGAPVGSLLIGNREQMERGVRVRKVLGGTMRQAGYIAAGALFALENNIERLRDDHLHAAAIAEALGEVSWVKDIMKVSTNIIIFNTPDDIPAPSITSRLRDKGVLANAPTSGSIRMVTHMDVTPEMVSYTIDTIRNLTV